MAEDGKEVAEAEGRENTEATTDGVEEGQTKKPATSKKKKILIIAGAGVALLILIGVGLFFLGIFDSGPSPKEIAATQKAQEEAAAEEANKQTYFYKVSEILVNLNTKSRRKPFLKLTINLEVTNQKDFEHLDQVLPKILDNFQVYLRELTPEDLKGSEGIYRLREELLLRVNRAAYPVIIKDVLFLNILTQ